MQLHYHWQSLPMNLSPTPIVANHRCKEATEHTLVETITCGGCMTVYHHSFLSMNRARCLLQLSDYYLFISRLIHCTKTGASCIPYWASKIQHLHWPTSYSHAVVIVSFWVISIPFERTLQDLVAIRVQVDSFSVSVCQVYEIKMKCPEVAPFTDTGGPFHQNFNSILRRDYQKNFLWASRLWVGRRKEPIFGYVMVMEKRR